MVEPAFVEMHIDDRRVGDARDTVILHPAGQDVARSGIDLARLIERVTDALNDRARRLAAGKRRCRDLADRNAGRNVEHAHMTEPGVDFDLDHLHRARDAGANHDIGDPPHDPAEDRSHETRLLQRRTDSGKPWLLVLRPHRRGRKIGRGRDQFTPWRIRARRRRLLCVRDDGGLEFFNRKQCRRDHRGGGPAAGRRRPFRQIGIADPHVDVMRFKSEFLRDGISDHAARTGPDVLDRGADDQASTLDHQLDRRAGLPKIEPVAGRDPDAAAVAAGLCFRRLSVAPELGAASPVVKPLPAGIGIPAFAQEDRIDLHPQACFVDRLFQRERHRRPAGRTEGASRRQIADDVVIGQRLRLRGIDQARKPGDRRVHGSAGVGMGSERQGLELALRGRQ